MNDLIPAFEPLYTGKYKHNHLHGGRGSGKSIAVADLLIALSKSERCVILCTREIQKSIKESVYSLLIERIETMGFTSEYNILKTEIEHKNGSRFIFSGLQDHTVESVKSYQNVKYCWVEEAQSVSQSSLNILIPTLREPQVRFFYTYNRKKERDPIYHDLVSRLSGAEKATLYTDYKGVRYKWSETVQGDTIAIYINHDGNPYFPDTLKAEMERMREKDYDRYLHVWEGQPELQAEKAILSRASVLEAMRREVSTEGGVCIGCDVARFGDDRTVIYKRKGLKVIDSVILRKSDTVNTANTIMAMCDKTDVVNVDDTGVGGGVSDILNANGYNVNPVNFGSSAQDKDKYGNTISEMWFYFRDLIDTVQIPDDMELLEELTDRMYKYDSKQRMVVESKDDYKKRNMKSPDKADALLLNYYNKQIDYDIKFI